MQFTPFQKVPRLTREVVITEKIDGTNASIHLETIGIRMDEVHRFGDVVAAQPAPGGCQLMYAGSRKQFITPAKDNFGFARWVAAYSEELFDLGEGSHYGEWWGNGIQRKYGMDNKVFSLFNADTWSDAGGLRPSCCSVVPVLFRGMFDTALVDETLDELSRTGSIAAPGFKDPEGVMVYHTGVGNYFKKTFDNDGGKWVK